MEYSKGERSVSQTTKGQWVVTIGGGLHTPRTAIGKFTKREDALLDAVAPELYEACKAVILDLMGDGETPEDAARIRQMSKAIAKAEGK